MRQNIISDRIMRLTPVPMVAIAITMIVNVSVSRYGEAVFVLDRQNIVGFFLNVQILSIDSGKLLC